MNVTAILRYTGLLMAGLLAGSSISFVAGLSSALDRLSADVYADIHQTMNPLFGPGILGLYFALVVFLSLDLYSMRSVWKSREFVLVAFSLICICDEFAMTWTVQSLEVLSLPANWIDVRSQWERFMYIRSSLLVAGFALLLVSTFFMKRFQPSQRDAFAAV
ncbi:MAG: DUF1772 domain-containing protein [Bdellovibrio sp.]|nr:DUF1772 domain-containing protein [Bdellovibrio sp.]